MFAPIYRSLVVLVVLGGLLAEAPAQEQKPPVKRAEDEYRQFFKKPETAFDFWAALKFEMEVGKFDLAADYLKGFLAKNPTDDELLQIETEDGMAGFLRLLLVPELRDAAKPLVERVSAVVKKHLTDPERIQKFIKNLNGDPEERAYAVGELRRSGAVVVPYLLEAVRASGDVAEQVRILSALRQLNNDIVPPLLAFLFVDPGWAAEPAEVPWLRVQVIDLLQRRGVTAAVPYLWYLAASARQPDNVRQKATQALVYLQGTTEDKLTPAKLALTREAERYYQRKVKFGDPQAVTVWQWNGKQFVMPPPVVSASQAEEYYGLRFARQALDLDPTYDPAQVVFLSLALEKGFERAGLDQPLEKGAPGVKELLKTVNPDLVSSVLERGLADHRLPVILGAVRALGDVAEVRAARPLGANRSPPLVRALDYPDRRVQTAAAEALLSIPNSSAPLAPVRTVEVLRRALEAEALPRALVADPNPERAAQIGAALGKAGFEPVIVHTGRDALVQLQKAADIDVILVDPTIPYPPFPYLLAQLRADVNFGLLPLLVMVPPGTTADDVPNLQMLIGRHRNTWLLPLELDPQALRKTLLTRITEAEGKPLSADERKANAAMAMVWLKRMAAREVLGYDVRPAQQAILDALRSEELGLLALEAAGHLPGREVQRKLFDAVLTGPDKLRNPAAIELVRHIQQHGLLLTAAQVKALDELYNTTADAPFKANVARILGALRPDAGLTGTRLERYSPPAVTPAAPPEEKPAAPAAPPEEKPAAPKEEK